MSEKCQLHARALLNLNMRTSTTIWLWVFSFPLYLMLDRSSEALTSTTIPKPRYGDGKHNSIANRGAGAPASATNILVAAILVPGTSARPCPPERQRPRGRALESLLRSIHRLVRIVQDWTLARPKNCADSLTWRRTLGVFKRAWPSPSPRHRIRHSCESFGARAKWHPPGAHPNAWAASRRRSTF